MTLEEAKKLLGCTLDKELADMLGITPAAVSKWDSQEIPLLRKYQVNELASKPKPLNTNFS